MFGGPLQLLVGMEDLTIDQEYKIMKKCIERGTPATYKDYGFSDDEIKKIEDGDILI